jgi:hypothetical protein
MDPHHFGKFDLDPHKSENLDPGPHQIEKQDPDRHQSENVEALGGHFGALAGQNLGNSECRNRIRKRVRIKFEGTIGSGSGYASASK